MAKKRKLLSKYHSKFSTTIIGGVKQAFDRWKAIPNVKKIKGRAMLLRIIKKNIDSMN